MEIGAKMATQQEKSLKKTALTCFSPKSPRILNFWNKFGNPHIKPFFRWIISNYWDINFVSKCLPAHCGMSFPHLAFIGWQVDLTGTGSFLLGSLSESPQQCLHTLGHGLCQPPECPSKELLSGWLWQRRQINSLPSHFPSLAFCRFKKKIC